MIRPLRLIKSRSTFTANRCQPESFVTVPTAKTRLLPGVFSSLTSPTFKSADDFGPGLEGVDSVRGAVMVATGGLVATFGIASTALGTPCWREWCSQIAMTALANTALPKANTRRLFARLAGFSGATSSVHCPQCGQTIVVPARAGGYSRLFPHSLHGLLRYSLF